MNEEIEQLKKDKEKLSKDYLEIYIKLEKTKALVKDLITKYKREINFDNFTFMSLEHLGDLKQIQDMLVK